MLALRHARQVSSRSHSLLLATPVSSASRSLWHDVRSSGIRQVRHPIADNQRLEKTWGFSGHQPIHKLKLSTPGLAYVSVVDDIGQFARDLGVESTRGELVAVVRATSDSSEVLERLQVQSRFPYRTLLEFDGARAVSNSLANAHLLTEIVLPRSSALQRLGFSSSGDVVVDPRAIATADRVTKSSVKIAATGNRRVFLTSEADEIDEVGLSFGKLSLATAMNANVHLSAPRISARDRINIATAGGSNVTFGAESFDAGRLSIAVAGGANASIRASEMTVEHVRNAIMGGGSITLEMKDPKSANAARACEYQDIVICGGGSVDSGDLVTADTKVQIVGQGVATIQASEALTLHSAGDSRVLYHGETPRVIRKYGTPGSVEALGEKVKTASEVAPVIVPTRESAFAQGIVIDSPWAERHQGRWGSSRRFHRFGKFRGMRADWHA